MNAPYHAFESLYASNTASPANPSTPHASPSRCVLVTNLPREANEDWLRRLFAPVGRVEAVDFAATEGSGSATLLFGSPEQANAALQFNGFNALGINLHVRPFSFDARPDATDQDSRTLIHNDRSSGLANMTANAPSATTSHPRLRDNVESGPMHKNLYILNLPLDATTDQLTALFATYGSVVHCVILAMLDAQARRRGFIDMSTPNEAKEAIEGLNGFVWHGYPIEVSYAIVQRSGGPFDQSSGRNIIKRNVPRNRFNTGPRRIPSESAIDPNFVATLTQQFERINHLPLSAGGNMGVGRTFGDRESTVLQGELDAGTAQSGTVVDPFTIFIAGLDPVAIIDDDDFRRALEPYGVITAATLCRDENNTSRGFGIVTFASQQSASKACEMIDGKVIKGRRLTAHKYVYHAANASLGSETDRASPYVPISSASVAYGGTGIIGNATRSLTTPSPVSSAGLLPQLPLMPVRFGSHSSLPPTAWNSISGLPISVPSPSPSSHNHSIGLGGRASSIGAGYFGLSPTMNLSTGAEAYGVLPQTRDNLELPLLFKANTGNRAVEIKPDPNDMGVHKGDKNLGTGSVMEMKNAKSLGEAFNYNKSSKDAQVLGDNRSTRSTGAPYSAVPSHGSAALSAGPVMDTQGAANTTQAALARSPIAQTHVWSNGLGRVPASHYGVGASDSMSPQSVLSSGTSPASSVASHLKTPYALRSRDNATIWSQSHGAESGKNNMLRSWATSSPNATSGKRESMPGSALLSLQSDIVEKNGRTAMPALAPVGHEKTSSPMSNTNSGKNDV